MAGAVATPNQLNKGNGKKAVECIVGGSDLCTNDKGEACWKGHVMNTAKGAEGRKWTDGDYDVVSHIK